MDSLKVGQIVVVDEGAFGKILQLYVKDGEWWVKLDGDMYPYDYPVSDVRALSAEEKGD